MTDTTAVSTAVQGVDAVTLAGSTPMHDFSMMSMFFQADWMVKLVMLVLLLASFWSWAIIFEKWFLFRNVKAKAQKFESDFWSSEALDKFYEKIKKRANHPMAIIFVAAMEEWFRSKNTAGQNPQGMKVSLRQRILMVMQVSRNREIDRLEAGLGFLATTGSSAPFIGLFGTVWGIMNSFHGIALSKNTSLAAVAPGIAEALFATAIGLVAAIPAVIAYNKFSSELMRFSNKLEDFSTEFDTILSRQLEGLMAVSLGSPPKRRARQLKAFSEINVTPMVDVMLVLLVIFMVTAPMMTSGVTVDLPQTSAQPVAGQDEPLAISVTADGKIYIQKTQVALKDLRAKLKAVTGAKKDTRIFVRGDRSVDYGKVMQVVGEINASGFSKVALITETANDKGK